MNTVFKIKHHIATVASVFKKQESASRVAMFHDVSSSGKAPRDLYTVDLNLLKKFITLSSKIKKIETFESQNILNFSSLSITFDDGYLSNLKLAAPLLYEAQMPFTIFMISDFVDSKHVEYLNKEHLRELVSNPLVTIGGHGKTHRPLAELPFNEAREELRISKLELENILGREVTTMSFPHGSFNAQLLEAARELGYKKCGTSVPLGNSKYNDFKINRQCIYSCDTTLSFDQKIKGQWDWIWKKSAENI